MYKISLPILLCGGGLQLVYFAAPQYFPNAPQEIWGIIFWAGILMIIVSIILLLLPALPESKRIRIFFLGYMSLEKASAIAYELGRNTQIAEIAERPNSPNSLPKPIEYFAQWLIGYSDNPKMKLYGCKPPLNLCELIPDKEVFSNDLILDMDELILQDRYSKNTKYNHLYIKKNELKTRLIEIKERFLNV